MATVIDRVEMADGGWRDRRSALRLAVKAAKACLDGAGRAPQDVDLLINAGIYRDRNLGEPALAAMIQQDIHANPEDPHPGSHGTFSFDVVNGSCGVLTALKIADGFFRSGAIDCALVVASDADPGHGMSERFPFSPTGAALLCTWTDDDRGLGPVYWANRPVAPETFRATVGLVDHRNVLRFDVSADADEVFADAATQAARRCLSASSTTIEGVDAVVAAPAGPGYAARLAAGLGVPTERIIFADDERTHTASLPSALAVALRTAQPGARLLLVTAGAGGVAAAAMYRV
ncbi:3-oxoacyl-ACP synthase [Mycolicibacterium moriokaense]|nr:3-oxoacyl-ACP synthase [Mycolicibacterium moriokaense]